MEFSALPLAFAAGILSLLSPCVLPMVPAVTASAMRASKAGLWFLAGGIAFTFALGGTVLTYLFMSMGLQPDVMRSFAAVLMLIIGIVLVVPWLSDQFSNKLSALVSRLPGTNVQSDGVAMQFLVGGSLGLVWLPCVGPTLGAAIALASTGQDMGMSFLVMVMFGLGTALPLIGIGYAAGLQLNKLKASGKIGKLILGYSLLVIALMIFTGIDKVLEIWAIEFLPDWVTRI
ncbi:cytochrome c biogenesis CcdA family protein [Aliidiomarina sp.]|uniref:cytochrome c biogenesis CcdA family protein n=1 Tax=Aliidiomarina sp. TaxID=1872439 RepID=UPI003A4D58F7